MHITKMNPIDEECLSGYRASSYYPVQLGDVIHRLYTVKVKLGFGRSSTTWLCTDQKYGLAFVTTFIADMCSLAKISKS